MRIGILFGEAGADTILGMGAGFIAIVFLKGKASTYERSTQVSRHTKVEVFSLLGLLFIFIGTSMLLGMKIMTKYIGGVIVILIGTMFIIAAMDALRK